MLLAKMQFMAGMWRAERGESTVDEAWLPMAGGCVLGVSRTTRGGDTRFVEYLRIDTTPDGSELQIARGLGETPIRFRRETGDTDHVRFTSIDDPNGATIEYRRTDDGMRATVAGVEKGEPYTLVFDFRPVTD